MQDDLLNGQLTVEETLQYTARLRCPPHFTDEQRQARIDQVRTRSLWKGHSPVWLPREANSVVKKCAGGLPAAYLAGPPCTSI